MATPKKEAPKRGNGSGGKARKVREGLYRAEVSLGFDREGKRIRPTVYGSSKTEVDRKVRELLTDYGRGKIATPDRITVGEWLDKWLCRRKGQVSPTSYKVYADVVRLHLKPELGDLRLQALKRTHVRDLEAKLAAATYSRGPKKAANGKPAQAAARPLSASYRAKAFMYLRAALDDAVAEEYLPTNPAAGIKVTATVGQRTDAADKALTEDEILRFLDAAAGDPHYPLLYTLFSLGLRRGEALGLRWQDINLENGTLEVVQQVKKQDGRPTVGPLKTVGSRRRLHFGPDLRAVLEARRTVQGRDREILGGAWTDNGLAFTTTLGTPISPDNVNRSIERIRSLAGIRHFGSHACRHTMISLALRDGQKLEVVSAVAGNRRPSITADLYRTVYEDERRTALTSLADRRARLIQPEA